MRTVKWNAFLSGLCVFAVALGVVAGSARADVTTEKGSSILIFPKVRSNGTFDTIIQITNTSNSMVHARCFYVNASLFSVLSGLPCEVPSATCLPQWQETDFTIWLTKQQPTHWLVSSGRNTTSINEVPGDDGFGFDPGRVPPVGSDFEGELKCVEVSESEEPLTGNHLKGEATLKALVTFASTGPERSTIRGDVSKYNAIGIVGNPDATPTSNALPLDGEIYDACPAKLILNHVSNGRDAVDLVASEITTTGFESLVNTELTLVPCSENFETQRPTSSTVQFLVTNEFEQKFSASTTVTCYLSTFLTLIDSPTEDPSDSFRSVFSRTVLGTAVADTVITPVVNTDGTVHAVIGVAERVVTVFNTSVFSTARAAYNIHSDGSLIPGTGPEEIVLSEP